MNLWNLGYLYKDNLFENEKSQQGNETKHIQSLKNAAAHLLEVSQFCELVRINSHYSLILMDSVSVPSFFKLMLMCFPSIFSYLNQPWSDKGK